MKTHSLTLYLLKDGISAISAIKHDLTIKLYALRVAERTYELYVRRVPPKLPRWTGFFTDYIDPSIFGDVRSSAAVLLVPTANRLIALTFGYGRYMLADECWEERFGLKVVLNSIGEGRLRSIDKQTFDAIPKHSREQASRDASPFDFALDVERDLLRAVTGALDDTSLGKLLTGMDALKTNIEIDLANIEEPLSRYVSRHQETTYKTTFPWVDYLSDVRSRETIDLLDLYLIDRLAIRDLDRCWLAAPALVDWSSVRGFRYSLAQRQPEYYDIHLETFLNSFSAPPDRETLSHRKIYCIGDDDQIKDEWSAYRCLYCEIDHGDESFLLSGGKWYQVARSFVEEVNQSFQRIPRIELPLPEYDDDSEGLYLKRTSDRDSRFALMDQKFIFRGPAGSKVEFCDLFTSDNDIIHVKKYGDSSVLSHLFSQGLVSGELFVVDPDFRKEAQDFLPISHRDSISLDRPSPDKFRVIFAIISQSIKPLSLPFFSRLSLRHASRRLRGFGYRVALAKIPVAELRRKLKKYPR